MPKSRKRGGEKAHRKRVQKRNTKMGNEINKLQKLWETEMATKLEEIRKQSEAAAQTEENNEGEEVINFVSDHTPTGDENKPLDIKI